ncbi:MAG: VTT domain-containing protein [Myxococcota bacterium]
MKPNPHTQPPTEPSTAPLEEEAFDGRRLALQTLLGIVGLMVTLGILGATFREPLVAFSKVFVEILGGPAIFSGIFIADALLLPIPHDVLTGFGLLGGMEFWIVVMYASVGSVVGGMLGYVLGRQLAHTNTVRSILDRRGKKMYVLAQRYGIMAVALGALSPLPYSLTAWAAGALRMHFGQFVLVSLLRIPRFAFYLWLIRLGFLDFQ